MSPDGWDDLIAGRVCPLCERIPEESEHGFRVAELRVSTLTLQRDQAPRGYCLVVLRRHAVELYDLAPRETEGFALDVRAAARAVSQVFVSGPRRPAAGRPAAVGRDGVRRLGLSTLPTLITPSRRS